MKTGEITNKSLLNYFNVGYKMKEGVTLTIEEMKFLESKLKINHSLWVFDDLWEEGYRFDDIINGRYLFIHRDTVGSVRQACMYLEEYYNKINKFDGTRTQHSLSLRVKLDNYSFYVREVK